VHLRDARVAQESADKGVLTGTGADDEGLHGRRAYGPARTEPEAR
jgi:hypothetical protein